MLLRLQAPKVPAGAAGGSVGLCARSRVASADARLWRGTASRAYVTDVKCLIATSKDMRGLLVLGIMDSSRR